MRVDIETFNKCDFFLKQLNWLTKMFNNVEKVFIIE